MRRSLIAALLPAALCAGVAAGGCGGRTAAGSETTRHGQGYRPKEAY